MSEVTETNLKERLESHDAPQLRPNLVDGEAWTPEADREAVEAAKERSTCSNCLARTYRDEECVCEDEGDAEEYDEALWDERRKRIKPNSQTKVAIGIYDPHGTVVELIDTDLQTGLGRISRYVEQMAGEGYPVSIIIEPEGAGE